MSDTDKVISESGIDVQDESNSATIAPYNQQSMRQLGVLDSWAKYADQLSWGKGQCLAILDDGCDLGKPAWRDTGESEKKVVATYNSIDGNDDPTPVPPGYHGTSVGYPSSMNHDGVRGVAYNNNVAHVRCVSKVHLKGREEAETIAGALRWVLENRKKYNITTVNLSPVDDERHQKPAPTVIDDALIALRDANVWVSSPCGNHHYTDGISWPACQPHCFAIGGTIPGERTAHLDRYGNTDLLATAAATSSSNAYAAACSMILREAFDVANFDWNEEGNNIPEALMSVFQKSGVAIHDEESGRDFRELNLTSALEYVGLPKIK